MEENPCQGDRKIHLFTAIVLVIIAALFVWKNLETQWTDGFYQQAYYGWPRMSFGTEAVKPLDTSGFYSDVIKPPRAGINIVGSGTNLLVAISSLFSVGFLVEIVIAFRKFGRSALRTMAGYFQIRLLTAVVLMLLAGILVVQNVTIDKSVDIWPRDARDENDKRESARGAFSAWTGWPCRIGLGGQWAVDGRARLLKERDDFKEEWKGKTVFSLSWDRLSDSWQDLCFNLVLNLFILIFVGALCELILRQQYASAVERG